MLRMLRHISPLPGWSMGDGQMGPTFARHEWDLPCIARSAASELEPILKALNTASFSKNSRERPQLVHHALLNLARAGLNGAPAAVPRREARAAADEASCGKGDDSGRESSGSEDEYGDDGAPLNFPLLFVFDTTPYATHAPSISSSARRHPRRRLDARHPRRRGLESRTPTRRRSACTPPHRAGPLHRFRAWLRSPICPCHRPEAPADTRIPPRCGRGTENRPPAATTCRGRRGGRPPPTAALVLGVRPLRDLGDLGQRMMKRMASASHSQALDRRELQSSGCGHPQVSIRA